MFCLPNTLNLDTGLTFPGFSSQTWDNYTPASQVATILELLASKDTVSLFGGHGLSKCQAIHGYLPRVWAVVFEASVRAVFDPENDCDVQITWNDFWCQQCGTYVSKALDFEHWDSICADCNEHKGEDCECCGQCEQQECVCCGTCGEAPNWCSCCSQCGYSECECEYCEDCAMAPCQCSHSSSHQAPHSYGSTKVAPWVGREDDVMAAELPTIDNCDKDNIDPVQAAADFYLLDAIKGGIRFSAAEGLSDVMAQRLVNSRQVLMSTDGAMSAVVIAAKRSHSAMVHHLAPNFLAYSLSAVGGELRYHRAVSGSELPTERGKAWKAFVKVVQVKGPSVLFDAEDLFNEFGGGSYGGERWGNAAKIVGKYLEGKMPDWMFVDRVFTLEHNGGCFLNKVLWAMKNPRGWDLYSMKQVLNAHAADDTDFATLLSVCSPGVRQLWTMSERAVASLVRRHGGTLKPVKTKHGAYAY